MIRFEVNIVEKEKITLLSEQLMNLVEESYLRFEKTKEKELNYDFYKDVKPYCDYLNDLLIEWESGVIHWIKKERPKYLTQIQIKNTSEHIEQISLQSFYGDTSRKRMKDQKESVLFILNSIVRSLKGE